MSNNSEPNSTQPSKTVSTGGRWTHLEEYGLKYFKEVTKAYDELLSTSDDIYEIANRYQLTIEDVGRAKDYAFGSGVSQYQLIPDEDMAVGWKRMASGQGTNIDEVLLRHEVFESDLVVNQGMNQEYAHELAQARYPWSELI